MYAGINSNFNRYDKNIKSAKESGIWCPTENLSGFDLASKDRVIFLNTKGAQTQQVQPSLLKREIIDGWFLNDVHIGELNSTIYSRNEYCQLKKIHLNSKLWVNDKIKNGDWRWNRVFEFQIIKSIKPSISVKSLFENENTTNVALAVAEIFCYGKSREISLVDYRNFLEFLMK